jgi:hypothetical protein
MELLAYMINKLDTTFEGTTTYKNREKDDALVDNMDEGRRPKETQY